MQRRFRKVKSVAPNDTGGGLPLKSGLSTRHIEQSIQIKWGEGVGSQLFLSRGQGGGVGGV